MNKYAFHLISTTWRKKSSVMFLAIAIILIIFGLHYSKNDMKPFIDRLSPTLIKQALGIDRVNFVAVNSSIYKNKPNGIKIEMPEENKYVISPLKAKASVNLVNVKEVWRTIETDQQLGVPFVNSFDKNLYIPKKRIVHLDLKGAPPLISYFRRFFPFIRNLGATGLLIEYEDMFPFDGVLKNLSAKNSYTKAQIIEILNLAAESHLEVIPLIQTFGHLEFALKLQDFSKLREIPNIPQALCPNRNGTLDFIREMVNQIMALHPNINHLHIGCDEVYQIGECELCRLELRDTLFLRHIYNVSSMILDNYPSLKLIIWDDMLRHIPQEAMLEMNLGKLVEPMVWVYVEDIYRFVQPLVWDKYAATFRTVWAASAFKGAFGEALYVPDAKRHLENNLRWLDLMSRQSGKFKDGFAGLVLTGWQRYDHFAVLCELLPSSTPSLALSLTAVTYGYFNASLKSLFLSGLSCPRESPESNSPFISLDYDQFLWERLGRCMFSGSQVFRLVYKLHSAETETKDYLRQTKEQKGWMTAYHARRNFSSPLRVQEIVSDLPRMYQELLYLVKLSFESMEGIFDNYTIFEWVEQRIYPYILELEQIETKSIAIKSAKVWPVRPLPILPDLKRIVNVSSQINNLWGK
ncbi:hypothetical protein WA026_012217 [Henosepilachna vigintioctopunctata]|uniref:beta-N-acetylhexosaminidase n=1 Tax=Henosepilachna vigintioctopunctata TaxID=420089 RepID=A0AAW1V6X5_9CUCU